MSSPKYIAFPNGSCWYEDDETFYSYNYAYDCRYFYNWRGISIVNYHTLKGYSPTVYMGIMAAVFIAGTIVSSISLCLIQINKSLILTTKLFLFAASFLSLFKAMQMAFNTLCVMSHDPTVKSNKRFNCLNLDGYPMCGLFFNHLLSGYAQAVLITYRVLHWALATNRFLAVHYDGRFFSNLGRAAGAQVLLCLICCAAPYLLQIGPGTIVASGTIVRVVFGFYFHPITFVVREYWQQNEDLFTYAPTANLMSGALDLVVFGFEYATAKKVISLKNNNVIRRFMDLNLQYQLAITHIVLTICWAIDLAFFYTYYKRIYHLTTIDHFVFENLAGWIIAMGIPLVTCFFNKPKRLTAVEQTRVMQPKITMVSSSL